MSAYANTSFYGLEQKVEELEAKIAELGETLTQRTLTIQALCTERRDADRRVFEITRKCEMLSIERTDKVDGMSARFKAVLVLQVLLSAAFLIYAITSR